MNSNRENLGRNEKENQERRMKICALIAISLLFFVYVNFFLSDASNSLLTYAVVCWVGALLDGAFLRLRRQKRGVRA